MKKIVVLMVLVIGVTLFSSCGCLGNLNYSSRRSYPPMRFNYGYYNGTQVTDYAISTGLGGYAY